MRKLALVVLAFAMFLRVAAAEPLAAQARGDLLARWSAYEEADRAYLEALRETKDDGGRLTLLLRRLAIAEARADTAAVNELLRALEANRLSRQAPEAQLRIALARAGLAVRTGRTADARRHFEVAERLAGSSDTPATRMVRYVVGTWRCYDRLLREGRPTPHDFKTASVQAFAPLMTVPMNQPFEPLDMIRAAGWGRFWIRQPLGYMVDTWREKDTGASLQWYQVATEMAMGGRGNLQRREAAGFDPEARFLAMEYAVDMAWGLSGNPAAAETWLALVAHDARKTDEMLATVTARVGGRPVYVEQLRVWEGYHRARALVLLTRGAGRATAPENAEALREYGAAIEAAEKARLFLEVADLRNEEAGARMYVRPAGWEGQCERTLAANAESCEEMGYAFGRYVAMYWLGKLFADTNRLPQAERWLRQAVESGEAMISEVSASEEGRREMRGRAASVYDLLMDVLIRQGKTVEAAELSERQRQAMVVGALDVSKVRTRDPKVAEAFGELARTRERAADLQQEQQAVAMRTVGAFRIADAGVKTTAVNDATQELASNRAQFYQALNRIRTVDPDYERLVNIRPTSFSKLQPRLPAGTLLVQYFAAVDRLYVFTATPTDLRIRTVPVGREALAADVDVVREALVNAVTRTAPKLGAEETEALLRLHDALIKPVEDEIRAAKVLVVVPSGTLYYLPFSALARRTGARLEFLAERIPVVTMTSLELLDVVAGRAIPPVKSILAFGNPDGTLPGAQREVSEVAALFNNPHVYMQGQAIKSLLLRVPDGTSVVHLATHGVLDPRDVNRSYLVVAGGGEDGRLTAGEIYGLDLRNVSLVTLSACKTALGGANPGAEIATLAQAFSVAGSRSMLASLWNVSDDATRAMMVEFYRQLVSGRSLVESLQRAQLALLARPETAHPAFWSAFVLIGDWR